MRTPAIPILLISILLIGCKPSDRKEPEISDLPSNAAAFLKTKEGKKVIEAVKEQKAGIARTKQILLNQTDHAVLLRECRWVMANRRALEMHNYGPAQSIISGDSTNLPPLIKAFKTRWLDATDHKLEIELGSGFHHYGIVAFSDGRTYESSHDTKKLLDGLWFYEEPDR